MDWTRDQNVCIAFHIIINRPGTSEFTGPSIVATPLSPESRVRSAWFNSYVLQCGIYPTIILKYDTKVPDYSS